MDSGAKRLGLLGVLVVATVVSGVTHVLAVAWFVVGVCGVSDQAEHVPAPASAQGRICDAGHGDDWWGIVGYGGLAASAALAVLLAGFVWQRAGRGRWLALLVPAGAAVVTLGLLAVPSDACSDETRRAEPALACDTSTSGAGPR